MAALGPRSVHGRAPQATGGKLVRIVVREVINDLGNIFEEGQKLHDLISPILARGEEVELDFEGTRYISTPFLTTSIGQLLKDHPLERVKSLLRVQNLDALDRQTLELVIDKSSRYYTEPRYREAMDRFLAGMFEDQ
jgi:hypothetical protein